MIRAPKSFCSNRHLIGGRYIYTQGLRVGKFERQTHEFDEYDIDEEKGSEGGSGKQYYRANFASP